MLEQAIFDNEERAFKFYNYLFAKGFECDFYYDYDSDEDISIVVVEWFEI